MDEDSEKDDFDALVRDSGEVDLPPSSSKNTAINTETEGLLFCYHSKV